jgi:HK97 family phage portal protein
MSLLRNALEGRSGNPENPETRLTGSVLIGMMEEALKTGTGKSITTTQALSFPSVWRAVTLLSGLTGSMPIKAFKGEERDRVIWPIIDDNPAPGYTRQQWMETAMGHLLTNGNFCAFKLKDPQNPKVTTALLPYQPKRVTFKGTAPTSANPSGRWFEIHDDEGQLVATLSPNEIFHVSMFSLDGFVGLSPIGINREAIAAGLSAQEFANKLWSNGVLAAGILTTDKRLDDTAARSLKRRWKERVQGIDAAYDIAVMDSGTKFQQLTIPMEDAQFLESRFFSVEEVARMFGLPPHMLSHQERQTSWGTGIEQHNIGFVTYTLQPVYLTRIEARLTELLQESRRGSPTVEFVLAGLLRGDSQQRSQFYMRMRQIGAMSPNEVRRLENMPPFEGGDDPLAPVNFGGNNNAQTPDPEDDEGGKPAPDDEDEDDRAEQLEMLYQLRGRIDDVDTALTGLRTRQVVERDDNGFITGTRKEVM